MKISFNWKRIVNKDGNLRLALLDRFFCRKRLKLLFAVLFFREMSLDMESIENVGVVYKMGNEMETPDGSDTPIEIGSSAAKEE